MLFNELEILETLVHKELNPEKTSEIPKEILEKSVSIAFEETSIIKQKFCNAVIEIKEDNLISLYVHSQQHKLVSLADVLYLRLSKDDPLLNKIYKKPCLTSSQKFLYEALLDLLNFLEVRFAKYLNKDEKVPDGIRNIAINEFHDKINKFNSLKHYRYPEILKCITDPVENFINKKDHISIAEFNYIKQLLDFFLESLPHENEYEYILYITKNFVYLNFNTLAYYNFITDKIKTYIDTLESRMQKIERLSWYLKELYQAQENPSLCFNFKMESLKTLLIKWFEEEISHYDRTFKFSQFNMGKSDELIDIKVSVDLSVDELGILLRAFVENKIVTNSNKNELINFIAANTRTKMVDSIEAGSLRNKYYSKEHRTIESLKSKIISVLNYLQKIE